MPVAKSRAQTARSSSCGARASSRDAEPARSGQHQAKARLAECGEEERTAQGSGAEDGGDQAEHVRVGVEAPPRQQRQQHVEVEREDAQREHHEERNGDPTRPANERERHPDAPAKTGLDSRRDVRTQVPHREQRDHDRDVAERVDRERHARPRQSDDEPSEGRPDDSRRRAESGAEGDRIGQVAFADDPGRRACAAMGCPVRGRAPGRSRLRTRARARPCPSG